MSPASCLTHKSSLYLKMNSMIAKETIKKIALFFLGGAILLSVFSIPQKIALGADPFIARGYIVPILFGGLLGAVVGWMLQRNKRLIEEKYQSDLRLQEELKKTNKRLENRVDEHTREIEFQNDALNHHAIVSITDVKGNIIYANDKFCEISGYELDELIGKNHRILKSDEHKPEFFVDLWKTVTNGKVWHGDIKNKKKDGGYYWVRATIVPFMDKAGKPFKYVAIRTDITERKMAEEELFTAREIAVKARRDAELANQAKSDFLANMSHELRTPLNAIIGFSDAMTSGIFGPINNDKHCEYIEHIHNSGSHLLSLINEILDLSKIDSGSLKIIDEDVILDNIIVASVTLLQTRIDGANLKLKNHTADNSILLRADSVRVKQVLINLLSNAVKFTPEGGEIIIDSLLNDDGSFSIFVSDTGYGMSDGEVAIAMSKFGQVDSGHDRNHEGAGLGLPLTKGLMELHGGTLEIDSLEGYGTMVTVTFPKERVIQNVG